MAMKASELKKWAAALDDDQIVGIEDGGLAINVVASDAYIELGGMPDETADWSELLADWDNLPEFSQQTLTAMGYKRPGS